MSQIFAPAPNYVTIDYNASALVLTAVSVTTVIDAPLDASFAFSSNKPMASANAVITDAAGIVYPLGVTLPTLTSITFTVPSVILATGLASLVVTAIDVYGNPVSLTVPVGVYRPLPFDASLILDQAFDADLALGQPFDVTVEDALAETLDAVLLLGQAFDVTLDLDQSFDAEWALGQAFEGTLNLDQSFDVSVTRRGQ